MPIVSVLMGVYYRKTDLFFLKRSLKSLLVQSISDLEILICDDGSTEDACKYLSDMAQQDSRIQLIRTGKLFSLPEKLNACLTKATGTWIARMDDDDYAHVDRFECQIAFMKQHPEIAFVGCQANLWKSGKIVGVRHFPELPTIKDFYFTQPYLHPALMFRKEALMSSKGYSTNKYCILCEDYDLLLRLYHLGYQGANLSKVLIDYTIPETAKGNRKMKHRWNEMITRFRRFKELGVLPSAFPYVFKPIVVGLIPDKILCCVKNYVMRKAKENTGIWE